MPHRSDRKTSWKREAATYVLVYGIPLVLLFPGGWFRPDAEFQATVKAQAVDFTLDQYGEAGLFLGPMADISFDNIDHVEIPGGPVRSLAGGRIRFRGVTFNSLLLPRGTGVRIEWYERSPTGVRMVVRYGQPLTAAAASVFLDKGSRVESTSGTIDVSDAETGVSAVYARPDTRMAISLTPVDRPRGPKLIEQDLPLLAQSPVRFTTEDRSSIVGNDAVVQVVNADRKDPVFQRQRLEIGGLRGGAVLTTLAVDNGIDVAVRGAAGTLRLEGRDLRPSPAEYLRAQKVLSTWITTSLLIGTAVLTVASRTRLIKLEDH
jgi:hypothetical protein